MSALKNRAMYPGCVDDPVDHKMSESGVIFLGLFSDGLEVSASKLEEMKIGEDRSCKIKWKV